VIHHSTGSRTRALVASSENAFLASLVYFFMVDKPITDPAAVN